MMDFERKYKIAATVLGFFLIASLIVLSIVAMGWSVKTLWNACLVPQGASHMDLGAGIGLIMLTHILFGRPITYTRKSKGENK